MIARRVPLVLILCLAAGLLGARLPQAAVLAQEEPPRPAAETPPSRLSYDGVPEALPLPAGVAAQETAPAEQAPEYAVWSRLVFQSLRNQHDWDVYGARGDGTDPVNLSNQQSMDVHPRLNRGAMRVAFASNRFGAYEIFVMNADGSGLARLTINGTDDLYPAWSFDGSRIAFQAYRNNGQAEIYVMNADGSGQTRLTNYGDFDGMPAWSPDGSRIAFVRRRRQQPSPARQSALRRVPRLVAGWDTDRLRRRQQRRWLAGDLADGRSGGQPARSLPASIFVRGRYTGPQLVAGRPVRRLHPHLVVLLSGPMVLVT
jgi:hypothetical protein